MVAEKKKEGRWKEKAGRRNCFVVGGQWGGLEGKRI